MRLINGSSVVFRVEEIPIPTDKNQSFYEGCRYMQKRALRILHAYKTIDAVPVVRCKDCKRCVHFENELICNHALPTKSLAQYLQMGTNIMAIVQPNDFCSYGERRGDGNAD